MIPKQYRQGDVLVDKTAIPAEAVVVECRERIVLAEGEATGHAHAVLDCDRADLLEADGVRYLRVKSPVDLVHEEHGTITIEPGEYVIRRQVEQWMDEVRQVAD